EDANPRLAELLNISLEQTRKLNIAQFVSLIFAGDVSSERGAKQHALCTALVAALRWAPTAERRIIVEIETDDPDLEPTVYELRLTSLSGPLSSLLVIVRDVTAQTQTRHSAPHFIPASTRRTG